jgi:hypothetical protein
MTTLIDESARLVTGYLTGQLGIRAPHRASNP